MIDNMVNRYKTILKTLSVKIEKNNFLGFKTYLSTKNFVYISLRLLTYPKPSSINYKSMFVYLISFNHLLVN